MPELCYNAAMATITLEVPDELAQRLEGVGEGLPWLLMYALDLAGIPGRSILPDTPSPWDEVLAFLGSRPKTQDILNYKISDEAQERLEELLDLNREGMLTPQERDEVEVYFQIDHLFTMLKAHLRAPVQ